MAQSAGFLVSRRDAEARGYTIDYKCLILAYLIEACVVSTSLLGAWLLAQRYGHDDSATVLMMMLAPVAFACVELARVPLAFSMRIQTSAVWRVFFALMVLAAAGVTVKSLSQLGEMMFRPRLYDVMTAQTALNDAKRAKSSVYRQIADADAVVSQGQAALTADETRLREVNAAMGGLPKPQCSLVTAVNHRGQRYSRQQCSQDPRVAAMQANLADAQTARALAAKTLETQQAARAKLDHDVVDGQVARAEVAERQAVMQSQLHSFAAMVFGKDPTDVTDAEIHAFLRWFVFFPAIFASLAATALAIASVNWDRAPPKAESVALDERAVDYILEPILQEARQVAAAAALAALSDPRRAAQAADVSASAAAPAYQGPPAPEKVVTLRTGAHG